MRVSAGLLLGLVGVAALATSLALFMVGIYMPLFVAGSVGVLVLAVVGFLCFIGALSQRRWPLALVIMMLVPAAIIAGALSVYMLAYADYESHPNPIEVLVFAVAPCVVPVVAWLLLRATFGRSQPSADTGASPVTPAPPPGELGPVPPEDD